MYGKEKREVEIIMKSMDDVSDDMPPSYYVKLVGYVELHLHEIDGSQTILIRTKRRDTVEKFLDDEVCG